VSIDSSRSNSVSGQHRACEREPHPPRRRAGTGLSPEEVDL